MKDEPELIVEPVKTAEPAAEEQDIKAKADEQDIKPTADEQDIKPTADEQDIKPTADEQDIKPTADEQDIKVKTYETLFSDGYSKTEETDSTPEPEHRIDSVPPAPPLTPPDDSDDFDESDDFDDSDEPDDFDDYDEPDDFDDYDEPGNTGEPGVPDDEEPRKKRKIPIALLILIPVVAAVIIAALVYTQKAEKYNTVFFDNTWINGVDVSGMTAEEADRLVSSKGEDYAITISFRDGTQSVITGDQIDYGYHAYDEIAAILSDQNTMRWILENNEEHDHTVELIPDYNKEMLDAAVAAVPQLQAEAMTAPTDAYVTIEDNRFVVVPETQGNMFDNGAAAAAITQAVSEFAPSVDIGAMPIYAAPQFTSEMAAQANHVDELNFLLSSSITYEMPEQPSLLDGSVLITWLTTDENGFYYKDEELWNQRIRDYVESIAAIIQGMPNTWEFDTTGLGTVTIQGGTYHQQVDVDAEAAELARLLSEGAVVSRSPIMKTASGSSENHGLGSTYVEIDLSRQKLWAYENGELIMSTPIVSGRMTEDRYTPAGVFYVYYKQRDRVLRGDVVGTDSDGEPIYQYASHVSYWMPFNGGIGMHDADWRGAFGGEIYLTDGSHGCINMPVDEAPKMYEWITSDIPIVVYYSEPYTLAPSTGEKEVVASADNTDVEYVEPAPETDTDESGEYDGSDESGEYDSSDESAENNGDEEYEA